MIIQPFGDRVLVKVIAPEEKTIGGLIAAPVSKEHSNRGIVEAVGEGTLLQDGTIKPLRVEIGDEVLFQAGTGLTYNTETELYRILSSRDILCKLIEKENR